MADASTTRPDTGAVSGQGADPTGSPDAIGHALTDVTQKVQLLVREEVELAKAEVSAKAAKLGRGIAVGAAAGVFVLAALLLILHGLSWLAWYLLFPAEQFFWGFFLVAVVLLILGALAGYLASRFFRAGNPPMPEMAIEEAQRIRETVQRS